MKRSPFASSFLLSLCLFACNNKDQPAPSKLALPADPGAAMSVKDAKAAGAKDHAVVQGRIAKMVQGRAAFTLMDLSLPYCGEGNAEDKCKTPWDYCCESEPTRHANSLLVEARSADGKPLPVQALPDLRLVDAVKVQGRLEVDEHGNPILVATGLFRTERPKLPDYVKWPQ
jgi:hypothetical protein